MKSLSTILYLSTALFAQARPQAPKPPSPGSLEAMFPGFGKKAVPFGPAPAGCAELEIIIARGTSEPGPFGTIVGDPLVEGVAALVPGSRGYAVQYPANMSAESIAIGAADVVKRVTEQSKTCPSQKLALVGYSQGARVQRAASKDLPKDAFAKIVALVMFGDRGMRAMNIAQFPPELAKKLWENCAHADPACAGYGTDAKPHLTYNASSFQVDSAKFIAAAFKGTPMPARPFVPDD